ncbi:hypothetical protein ACOSP6_04755 [Tenacibaculum sp. MEBiC06402]|uniref:hypothetical protein n=1 Tax=unclassified Tenacibaculum TaxID=2635139 RepID=UPI003B992480
MKKSILNLGTILNKSDQKNIFGGIEIIPIKPFPCELPVLAPPPPGCDWVKTGPCTYKLVCDSIDILVK